MDVDGVGAIDGGMEATEVKTIDEAIGVARIPKVVSDLGSAGIRK